MKAENALSIEKRIKIRAKMRAAFKDLYFTKIRIAAKSDMPASVV
jgi:hypothetical protein